MMDRPKLKAMVKGLSLTDLVVLINAAIHELDRRGFPVIDYDQKTMELLWVSFFGGKVYAFICPVFRSGKTGLKKESRKNEDHQ